MTKPIPDGYPTLTPHIIVNGAAAAIEFYKKAFGAVEGCRMPMPGTDKIMHAQVTIGNSPLMLMDTMEGPEGKAKSPEDLGGSPVVIHVYVDNVDEVFNQAVEAGAKALLPPTDMFWGDRYSRLQDPFGHEWSIATHVRDVTPDEMMAAVGSACAG